MAFAVLLICLLFVGEPKVDAQEPRSITLSIVEIDKNGERPAAQTKVYILPKNQGVTNGVTNSNGVVKFEFPPTESVVFRIGAGGGQLKMAPLSGRFNQSTSYIIDRRKPVQVYRTVSVQWGSHFATSGLRELISDIRDQSGGRLMNDQTRQFVEGLRQDAINATTPKPSASESEKESLAQAQQHILSEIDDLLAPPWKIKAAFESHPMGARITVVTPNGPAAIAGIEVGDIITKVDGETVLPSPDSFRMLIGNAQESSIDLNILRGQSQMNKKVGAERN